MSDAQAVYQRLGELVSGRVVDYCTERFFDRLHPTIPILTPEYVARLRSVAASAPPENGLESLCVLVGMPHRQSASRFRGRATGASGYGVAAVSTALAGDASTRVWESSARSALLRCMRQAQELARELARERRP